MGYTNANTESVIDLDNVERNLIANHANMPIEFEPVSVSDRLDKV